MKKQKLISDLDYDFDLIGITTSSKDYKLAWSINRQLGINLSKQEDHEILINNKTILFTLYTASPFPEFTIRLFSNKPNKIEKVQKNFLVPEAKHFDYVLMKEGESQSFSLISLQKELKEVPVIEYLAAIEKSKLKFKDHFVF